MHRNATPMPPGSVYGYLTVLDRAPEQIKRNLHWYCECVCGRVKRFVGTDLRNGKAVSCGCSGKGHARGGVQRHHGLSRVAVSEYRIWMGMRRRCTPGNRTQGPMYADRGIVVDPRWDDFAQFYADMGPRPGKGYSIDRIDNDGPYSPENCRWATQGEQSRNTRRNIPVTYQGRTMVATDWAQELGLRPHTIIWRLSRGWSVERALTTRPLAPLKNPGVSWCRSDGKWRARMTKDGKRIQLGRYADKQDAIDAVRAAK